MRMMRKMRMMRMMTRVGLDLGISTHGDPRSKAIMKGARRRCANCPVPHLCDRWFAGKSKGSNAFCPKARIFGILSRTGGRAG